MQFSLNKKISDKTSQNKDLSQCDIAISRQGKAVIPLRAKHLCHCERSVAIAGNGHLMKECIAYFI